MQHQRKSKKIYNIIGGACTEVSERPLQGHWWDFDYPRLHTMERTYNLERYFIITPSSDRWREPTVKLVTKTTGVNIAGNAVVMKINLKLPEALFKKPQLEATIMVNSDQISKPLISADVMDNIKEVLKKQTSADVEIRIIEDATQGVFHDPTN